MRSIRDGSGTSRRSRVPEAQEDPRFEERLKAINALRRQKGWPDISVTDNAPRTERALRYFAERSGVDLPQ